jgi:tetratricopeptide (TPR) repeat protein
MLGVIYHCRGSWEEARKSFERALSLNPRYTEAALNLVVTYNELRLYEDARRVYQQTLSLGKSQEFPIEPFAKGKIANLHAEVAQAYLDVGLLNEAAEELRKAISLCPQFADLRLRLANIYRQWNEPAAAKLELEQAIAMRPAFTPARVTLGVVLLTLGHTEEAVEQWKEVLKLEPENQAVQLYLRMAESSPQGAPDLDLTKNSSSEQK